ncbi:hypothetical protein CCYA_CCYA01G0310 [Cyanidiococcus yangmingshanensis]|nr:hypothetical protein CCYA_CCYA01G0310 [Cyanidiococcus yangmingshanensis]
MAKSIRSKVKRAFRSAARERLAERERERVCQVTSKLYERIGFARRTDSSEDCARRKPKHRGMEINTNFLPTPDPVRLVCVHGPLAKQNSEENQVERMIVETQDAVLKRVSSEENPTKAAPPRLLTVRRGTNSQRREAYRARGKKKHSISMKPISKRHPLNKRAAWKQKRS